MYSFKKMKKDLYIFLIINLILFLVINCIAFYLSFKYFEYLGFISILLTLFLLSISLKLYQNKFISNKQHVLSHALNEYSSTLNIRYRKQVTYEGLETLDLEKEGTDFKISNVISGSINNTNVLAYNASFSKDGSRRELIDLRIYIIEYKNKLDLSKINKIKSKLYNKSDLYKKCTYIDNKAYFSYGYYHKNLNLSLDPMSHKEYDKFLNRIKEEVEFINELVGLEEV